MIDPEEQEFEAPEPQEETVDAEPEAPSVEDEARRLGWKPETEWKGDKTYWVDADTFVERARSLPGTVKKLEERLSQQEREYAERLERIEAANKAAMERQRDRIRAEMRQAVEVGDVQRYDELSKQQENLTPKVEPKPSGPAPEVQEWASRNTWFSTDPVMAAAARQIAQAGADQGMTVQQQLALVDREIKQHFPHKFAAAPRHSAVDAPGQAPRKAAKGWKDIPAEDRRAARMFIDDGTMSEDEYAKEYWALEAKR